MFNTLQSSTSSAGGIYWRILPISGVTKQGLPAWFVIRVFPRKKTMLSKRLSEGGVLEIMEYGEVLASGYGKLPMQKTQEKHRKQWNITWGEK